MVRPALNSRLVASVLAGLLAVLCLSNSVLVAPSVILPVVLAAVAVLTTTTALQATLVSSAVWLLSTLGLLAPPANPAVGHRGDFVLLAVARENFGEHWSGPAFALSWLVLGLAVALLWRFKPQAAPHLGYGVTALLLLSCLASGPAFDPERLSDKLANPQPGYGFDGRLWMRIFYLTAQGDNFYHAFLQGFEDDAREIYPESLGKWRTPVFFDLWALALPADGSALFMAYLLACCAALVAAFVLAREAGADEFSLLAPVLLYPYLLYGAFSLYFPFVEYWAACLILISLAFYLRGWRFLGLGLGLLAFLGRELVLLYFVALTADYVWNERTRVRSWILAGALWVVAAVFYLAHRATVIALVGDHGTDLARVFQPGWLGSLWGCLRFGYLLAPERVMVIAACSLLGFLGAGLARQGRIVLVATAALTAVFFMVFSHGGALYQGRVVWLPDYWGTLLSPLLLSLAPVTLNLLTPKSD